MLFQVLGPRKSIVFCEKLVVASGVARLCDCLMLYLCMSLFSVNKSLNIFGVLLFLCLCTNLHTLIFSMSLTKGYLSSLWSCVVGV